MIVEFPFTDEPAVAKLAVSLLEPPEPTIGEKKMELATAAQVARVGGLKIDIFADEHPPPHFRVSYQGSSATYTIDDCTPMTAGLERFYRKIRGWHADHRAVLIEFWNRTRPTDCPVGEFKERSTASETQESTRDPDRESENAAFLAQFTEIIDESFLNEAEKHYVAMHRRGSFPNGKLGRKADGSVNLYAVDVFGPLCAMIRPPTDPAARKQHEDATIAFLEKARAAK